jgi:hypothetical protein
MYGSRDMSSPRRHSSPNIKNFAVRWRGEGAANQGETWAGGGPCAGLGRKRYARAVQPPFLSPFHSPFRGCACGVAQAGGKGQWGFGICSDAPKTVEIIFWMRELDCM